MSDYRDDVNDTFVLGESFRAKLYSLGESTIFLRESLEHSTRAHTADAFVVADELYEASGIAPRDDFAVADDILDATYRQDTVVESLRLKDALLSKRIERLHDSVAFSEDMAHAGAFKVLDGARFTDEFAGQRKVQHLVVDGVRFWDFAPRKATELLTDTVTLAESYRGRLAAKNVCLDALALVASPETSTTTDSVVIERLRITDELHGLLQASNLVADRFLLWDEPRQSGDFGQAWTTGMDGWAMTRFAPFSFDSLAVVDGVLYGCNRHGVFALDGDSETMTAELRTGAMDMTGGVLAHPLEAHVEYELRGTAAFGVTTTQSGTPTTYTYPLNARPTADALTNARAVFGRGLRGRHFAYTLRLTGQQAYINDWSVLVAPSKRSI